MTALADVDDVTLLDIALHGDCYDDPEWLEMLGMSLADASRGSEPVVAHGTHNQKDHGRRLPKSLDGDSPFSGFSREQLRKAARRRGIELARGEDRGSIERKLAKHLARDEDLGDVALEPLPHRVHGDTKAAFEVQLGGVNIGAIEEDLDGNWKAVPRGGDELAFFVPPPKKATKEQAIKALVDADKATGAAQRARRDTPEPAPFDEVAPTASPARMTSAQYASLLTDEFVRLSMLRGTSEQDAREQAGSDPSIDDLKERNTVLRAKLRQKGVDYRTEEQKRTDDAEKNKLLDEVERLANEAGHDGPAKRAGASKMSRRELAAFVADAKEFQARRKAKQDAEGKGSSAVAAFKAAEDKSRATSRQVGYIKGLLRERGLSEGGAPGPTSSEDIRKLSNAEARAYINRLLRGDH